jgi:hypothetical protein
VSKDAADHEAIPCISSGQIKVMHEQRHAKCYLLPYPMAYICFGCLGNEWESCFVHLIVFQTYSAVNFIRDGLFGRHTQKFLD